MGVNRAIMTTITARLVNASSANVELSFINRSKYTMYDRKEAVELHRRIIATYLRFAKVSKTLGNIGDHLLWSQLADIYKAKLTTLEN